MSRFRTPALPSGASIPRIVHHAHHGHRAARLAEAALLAAAGLGLTLAAAVMSGGHLAIVDPWLLASCAGAVVAASWMLATRRTARETAAVLDRRLGHGGALLTAYEAQRKGTQNALVGLLAARTAARLTKREALRAALPQSAFPIAAPFLAAAALALATEAMAPEPGAAQLSNLAQQIAGELFSARHSSLEALESGERQELGLEPTRVPARLTELLERVSSLQSEWQQGEPEPLRALEELRRLQQELGDLAAELPPSSPLTAEIRSVANLLDAAGMRVRDLNEGDGEAEASDDLLASDERGGKMSGRGNTPGPVRSIDDHADTAADTDAESPTKTMTALETGAAVARSWRPEYDEIVARWVESRRSAKRQ